jgi:hypothetical protein
MLRRKGLEEMSKYVYIQVINFTEDFDTVKSRGYQRR